MLVLFFYIPVFFDTVFFLLIPIARAMAVRAGGKYLYFVLAMAGAGAITHSMVPPTPGPLMIADGLGLEVGEAMVAGVPLSSNTISPRNSLSFN